MSQKEIDAFSLKLPPELREEFRRIMEQKTPVIIHDMLHRPLGGIRPRDSEGYVPRFGPGEREMPKIKIVNLTPEKKRGEE